MSLNIEQLSVRIWYQGFQQISIGSDKIDNFPDKIRQDPIVELFFPSCVRNDTGGEHTYDE